MKGSRCPASWTFCYIDCHVSEIRGIAVYMIDPCLLHHMDPAIKGNLRRMVWNECQELPVIREYEYHSM